jgi:hypothetical protein
MARIRTIKPDFWSDGKNVALSPLARLLFIGSWNFAICDNGHLPDDPFGLKLKVLPADDVDPTELLDELLFSGQVVRGQTADGRSYLHIPRLRDHQKIDGRWTPRCFVCSQDDPAGTQPASPELPETHASLDEARRDSPELPETHPVREGKGREKNVGNAADAAPSREDVEELCNHLHRRVIENGSRVNITGKWRDAARLLLDRDERAPAEIHALIDWCQDSEFWRANVQSMPKFREKYDSLRLQAQQRGGLRVVVASDGRRTWTTTELDRVLGPDMWRLPQPPRGLTGDAIWEWEQTVKREHRADRIRQAEAKSGAA